ncbi:hypothetical protein C1645_827905 [Glomus cerebriforme]|uniref:Uncharacterized protein n=1 Tax=Glomus cerebriforme TaxID=658196 RepID=A0A397SMS1_9GLOM|nr:hypothetical protein C1645_827905 [Glomus cerebriforme]
MNKNGYDLKKLIMENVDIPDIDMFHVWKVQISFNEKEKFERPKNIERMEIKDDSRIGDIFNNLAENSINILVQGHMCNICRKSHLTYLRTSNTTSNTAGKYAELLDDHEIQTVLDFKLLAKLNTVTKVFQKKFDEGKILLTFVGKFGDSGSAVFDDDGQLWGIYYGFEHPYHFIVSIHLILKDLRLI